MDDIAAEHLLFAHPMLIVALTKLFNLMLFVSAVPHSFTISYLVPIPKANFGTNKLLRCSDFRGIAISSTFSKLMEKAILVAFDSYFVTEENQFGFKEGIGCSHAIFSARTIIESFVAGDSTANICALDVASAFPSVNQCSLFSKLTERKIPVSLLALLEFWYASSHSCVKWSNTFSEFFRVETGLLQGSCLAPALFAVCINNVLVHCGAPGVGFILVYADDVLLISRSVSHLQRLVNIVCKELHDLDLHVNVAKSFCIRVGKRYHNLCAPIESLGGGIFHWRSSIRYLGVVLEEGRTFKCSFDLAKRKYNRAVNCLLSKLGRQNRETVLVQLMNAKCLPVLLFGTESCIVTNRTTSSLDFTVRRFLCKIFKTNNRSVIDDCASSFGVLLPSTVIPKRTCKFRYKFSICENSFCKYINVLNTAKCSGGCQYGERLAG